MLLVIITDVPDIVLSTLCVLSYLIITPYGVGLFYR